MPIYDVDDGTGRIFSIESDYEPTEAELNELIGGHRNEPSVSPLFGDYPEPVQPLPFSPLFQAHEGGMAPPAGERETWGDLGSFFWEGANTPIGPAIPRIESKDVKPQVGLPMFFGPGSLPGQQLSDPFSAAVANTGASFIDSLRSPLGIAMLPLTAAKPLQPVAKGLFGGMMASEAGGKLGEYSVTQELQDLFEGALMFGAGTGIAFPSFGKAASTADFSRTDSPFIELDFPAQTPRPAPAPQGAGARLQQLEALNRDGLLVGRLKTEYEALKAQSAEANRAAAEQLRAELEARSASPPPTEPPRTTTEAAPASDPLGPVPLDDIYKRFTPEPAEKSSLSTLAKEGVENLRTGFSSRFRPLDRLAEDIAKMYGGAVKRIAHIFEQLKGSSGKAEADIYRFDQDVSNQVRGSEVDFSPYMFLRRSLDRLKQDALDIERARAGEDVPQLNRRAVSDYTIPQLEAKLAALQEKIGPQKTAQFEAAANAYQQHMDSALRLQVESGRMSQEVYDAIKSGNEFYAPFKILKYIDESSRPEGSGRSVDTLADYTKAMVGIEDPNFKLGDMLAAGRQNIAMSRVLAEKNKAMQKFAQVANLDKDSVFVKKLAADADVPLGMESVNVMQGGKKVRYAVDPSVAQSVKLYNESAADWIAKALGGVATPFRAGATTANVAFQPVNLVFADAPRAALISKYGIRGANDLIKYPLDFVHGLYSAFEANMNKGQSASLQDTALSMVSSEGKATQPTLPMNKLYLDYLDSGAAGSVIQDYLSPKLLSRSQPKTFTESVLSKPADFARAVEEVNKLVGIKRAMRFEGAESGKALTERLPEAVTEVRRFSGSPDFGRIGSVTEAAKLNLIYMFFNARIQGSVADVGRLTGRDGAKTAAKTWGKAGAAIAVPTAALWYINNLPENKADYEARPKWERDNYWLIPKNNWIEGQNGEKIRDYWRIPKREVGQLVGNMTESALDFAKERDPQAVGAFAANTIENLVPINIRGENTRERIESTMSGLNPIFKAPVELATGRDTFRHRDIIPDSMQKASPEQQYTDRTPDIFKGLAVQMPDVAPEWMRSPLMLETMTRDFTANLLTQFTPQKPIKGREPAGSALGQSLMRRFQSAPYTDTEAENQAIDALEREAADEFLFRDRAARLAIQNAKEPNDFIDPLLEKYGDTPLAKKIIRRANDLWLAEKNGITAIERRVLNMPVRQRASYIAEHIKGLPAEQQVQLLEDYRQKRILTDAVYEELSSMTNAPVSQTPP